MIPWHDTMLAQHAMVSHWPAKLDQVVSQYLDSEPWKVKHGRRGTSKEKDEAKLAVKDMQAAELVAYNAEDCLLTAKIWNAMQGDLTDERHVYEHDIKLAHVAQKMMVAGIGVDHDRRHELSYALRDERERLQSEMRGLLNDPHFMPGKLDHVRRALYATMGARVTGRTPGGLPATNDLALEALSAAEGDVSVFAKSLMRWRACGKTRSTYIGSAPDAPIKAAGKHGGFDEVIGLDGRARYGWKVHGTVSGRLACRFQSVPRYDPNDIAARVREIYVPRKGCVFVYFDVSQAEMRLAAYLSSDRTFMAACQGDVHANNGKQVFAEVAAKGWLDGDAKKDPARGKPYRDISKNLGFAICYGAEAEKIYVTLARQGHKVSYRAVELILARLRAAYKVYYAWVESNVRKVRECGFMRSPILGRKRWMGWWPKPTEIANYPVQSGLADIINARMIELDSQLSSAVSLVAQVHDACVYEVPRESAGNIERAIKDIWSIPVTLAGGDCYLPIDLKRGERFSEL